MMQRSSLITLTIQIWLENGLRASLLGTEASSERVRRASSTRPGAFTPGAPGVPQSVSVLLRSGRPRALHNNKNKEVKSLYTCVTVRSVTMIELSSVLISRLQWNLCAHSSAAWAAVLSVWADSLSRTASWEAQLNSSSCWKQNRSACDRMRAPGEGK